MSIQDNLKRGTIEMVLLNLLLQEDKYGYQLCRDLECQSDGKYQLNEATLYPTLYRLTKNGYLKERRVQTTGKRFRIYYHITREGRQYLKETRQQYETMCLAINKLLNHSRSGKK